MTEEEKNKGVPPEDETVDLFREDAEKVEAEGDAEYSAEAEGSDTTEAKEPEQNGDSADAEKVTADDAAEEAGEAEAAKKSEDSGKKKPYHRRGTRQKRYTVNKQFTKNNKQKKKRKKGADGS